LVLCILSLILEALNGKHSSSTPVTMLCMIRARERRCARTAWQANGRVSGQRPCGVNAAKPQCCCAPADTAKQRWDLSAKVLG
jgi:hypothetical protein